jgi:DNA ligase (NAD+)
MDQAEARERIEKLRTEIEEHNRRYYVLNQPVISDFEYDILINELETLEKSFPEFSTKESPTLTVGSDITRVGNMNIVPMLSLGNTYNDSCDFDAVKKYKRSCGVCL